MTTKFISTLSILAIASFSLVACDKKETEPEAADKQSEATDIHTPPERQATAQAPPLEPGQLKTIMVGLGDEMTRLHLALWSGNFELISESAMKVADHAKVNDSEKSRIIKTLGTDFGAFVAMDKAVHGDAVRLSEAAANEDLPSVLKELSTLQGNCVSCHSQFRSGLTK